MRKDLAQKLQQISSMGRQDLRSLWEELFGHSPHVKIRREVLVRILAFRLQERLMGGIKPINTRRLRSLAERFESGKPSISVTTIKARAGTRMVREWQGRLHEVTALANGFEYEGATYRSLSEVARRITGTRWSGPTFFGLNKRRTRKAA